LQTRRLVLRLLGPDDDGADERELAELVAADRRPLAGWKAVPRRPGERERRYVVRSRAGGLLGSVSSTECPEGTVALSFWLTEGATGQGHAVEAAAAVAGEVWETTGAGRLLIRCAAQNAAGARVAANLGFEEARASGGVSEWILDREWGEAWSAAWRSASQIAGTVQGVAGKIRIDLDSGIAAEIALGELAGAPHLVVTCEVAAEDRFAHHELLEHNGSLAVGSLCLRAGVVVMRHACEPASLTGRALALLLHETGRLRGLDRATARPENVIFGEYAE